MKSSICPVCGKKHNTDNLCIWDNLTVVSTNIDYYSKRQNAYQNLMGDISEIKKLCDEIDVKSSKLEELERKIADTESQIEFKSKSINLDTQKNELKKLKISLNSLIQESTQLNNMIVDISDYKKLRSYLRLCRILINRK